MTESQNELGTAKEHYSQKTLTTENSVEGKEGSEKFYHSNAKMAYRFGEEACNHVEDDSLDLCGDCGWKCECHLCSYTSAAYVRWPKCMCPCRFRVVLCFVVLLGFFVVFLISLGFRRALLNGMAVLAMATSGMLSAVAATTDDCGWPAFLSISLVFMFPCAYSFVWQMHSRRSHNRDPLTSATDGATSNVGPGGGDGAGFGFLKPAEAVVMLFPGGETMLGMENHDEKLMPCPGTDDEGCDRCSAGNLEEDGSETVASETQERERLLVQGVTSTSFEVESTRLLGNDT